MNGSALIYTAVAASANVIGAAAVVSRSKWSVRALENMVALSAGFMISVALLDLTPDGNVTSGLRLGTPAATTRGFGVAEFKQVGGLIAEVLNAIAQSQDGQAPLVEASIKERVKALTDRFPIYQ